MKKIIIYISLILYSFDLVSAQTSGTEPTPVPQSTQSQPAVQEAPPKVNEQIRKNESFKELEEIKDAKDNVFSGFSRTELENISEIYRKTNKEELKLLVPSRTDLEKYADLLRQPKISLIKLMADRGCATNINVVSASESCLSYTMPGAGSSYSFRLKDYRIPRLADLTYINDNFKITGVLTQGILVNIGDVPLEKTTLQTKGIKFLADFEPQTTYQMVKNASDNFIEGILNEEFSYSRELKAVENTTFVLRSIAYEGESYQAFQGATYNELDFDKRKDVIIAFRIISKSAEDSSVTILWKELARKDSPKIKLKDNEMTKSL